MKIGIIGSGNIGGTLTKLFARHGHELAVGNSRGPDSLAGLDRQLGFAPVETGGPADGGRRQQPGAPVHNTPMKAPDAEAARQ